MSKRKRKASKGGLPGSVIASICLTLFIFSAAVVLILCSRWLYYLDIRLLHIEAYSGMSEEVIRTNYNALMDWCMLWHRSPLVLPTLPMSSTGGIHFQDCKRLFDAVWVLCIVSGIGSIVAVRKESRKHSRLYLRIAGCLCLIVPLVLGALAGLFWDQFFVQFHKLFFSNDYWLFDPVTDPVILILPDEYFYHCAIGILLIIIIGACFCFRFSAARRRRRR